MKCDFDNLFTGDDRGLDTTVLPGNTSPYRTLNFVKSSNCRVRLHIPAWATVANLEAHKSLY